MPCGWCTHPAETGYLSEKEYPEELRQRDNTGKHKLGGKKKEEKPQVPPLMQPYDDYTVFYTQTRSLTFTYIPHADVRDVPQRPPRVMRILSHN